MDAQHSNYISWHNSVLHPVRKFRRSSAAWLHVFGTCALGLLLLVCPGGVLATDQAASLRVVNDRWPDATSMERFALDAVRIMGARTEEEKALALFHFIRMFTARTDGKVPREPALGDTYIDDPLKVLNVYGAHHCDGLTRVMELAWRSLGGRAEKLYRSGHTQANVHWTDSDGVARWHLMDISEGWYVYDRNGGHIAGPDDIALDYSLIFRPSKAPIPRRKHYWGMWNWIHAPHLPWPEHEPGLTLRRGERVTLHWGNIGQPYQDNFAAKGKTDFEHGPYPVTYGNGIFSFTPAPGDPDAWLSAENTISGKNGPDRPAVHPAAANQIADVVYRITVPYIIADARISGTAFRQTPEDHLSLAISTNEGQTWREVWTTKTTGRETLDEVAVAERFDLHQPVPDGLVTPHGRYGYLVRLRMVSAGNPNLTGMSDLTMSTVTQHNIFALPMPWPGTNTYTVHGTLPKHLTARVAMEWEDQEGRHEQTVMVANPPFTFPLTTSGRRWEDVRAKALTIEILPGTGGENQLLSPRPEVRMQAEIHPGQAFPTEAIVGRNRPTALKSVADYLDDLRQASSQVQALSGLIVLRDPAALPALEHLALTSIQHPQKDMTIQALFLTDPDRTRPLLLEILDNSPRVRWKHNPENIHVELGHWTNIAALIGRQMATIRESAAVPLLVAVLERNLVHQSKSWQPQASIIRSLGQFGDERAITVIRDYLGRNLNVTAAAARALGELGDRDSLPTLRKAFWNSDYPMITLAAGETLTGFEDAQILPRMRELAHSADENLRALAFRAIDALGAEADKAFLEQLLADEPMPWVRESVRGQAAVTH